MANRSKLLSLTIRNIGCIGNDGLTVALDNIVCLVGQNNAGKSTVLRAYELAVGTISFDAARDRCQRAEKNEPSEIILDVHIPEGIGNIDEKWKDKSISHGLSVVRSRWQWASPDFKRIRTTWLPTQELPGAGIDPDSGKWSEDGKAGGADPVFNSRLPRPLRIGSLDDVTSEMDLLKLALEPALTDLKTQTNKTDSHFATTLATLTKLVTEQAEQHRTRFDEITTKVTDGFQKVFPGLTVRMDVQMASPSVKLDELLAKGSTLKVTDGGLETTLAQQGTGARRALFWAMLQVRSALVREKEIIEKSKKSEGKAPKSSSKSKKGGSGKDLNVDHPKEKADALASTVGIAVSDVPAETMVADSKEDPAFPGHILLMDEPENALHPMAARAAQRHLYTLAKDPEWQVMLTTHSPYFVNPLEDHTTIVRLERARDGAGDHVTPRTYRADSLGFDPQTKKRLQALQLMDVGLSEMFFGSYPVLVEGDTEHAAFVAAIVEPQDVLAEEITVVRARGKAILLPLIRILHHFRIPFGIIHDSDAPYYLNKKGELRTNVMWGENDKIFKAIVECRDSGLAVRHRVSLPDFERFLGGEELGKDKPLAAYERICEDSELRQAVLNRFREMKEGDEHCPYVGNENIADSVNVKLLGEVQTWALMNGVGNDPCYAGFVEREEPAS